MCLRPLGFAIIILSALLQMKPLQAQSENEPDRLVRLAVDKWKERPMWFAPRSVFLADLTLSYETAVKKTKFEGNGKVKFEQAWTQDVVNIDGVIFPRLLQHSDVKHEDKLQESQQKTDAEQQKKLEQRRNLATDVTLEFVHP